MNRILIAYYSFSSNTRSLAKDIAEQTGGDVRELIPKKAYSFNYNTAAKELRNEIVRGYCPALLSGNEPIGDYTTIFIGTPNWFKALAPPMLSFLRAHDFSGKTLVPFCTHGGGGAIINRFSEECPNSVMLSGFSSDGSATAEDIAAWLKDIKLI